METIVILHGPCERRYTVPISPTVAFGRWEDSQTGAFERWGNDVLTGVNEHRPLVLVNRRIQQWVNEW